jgi:hypothetical protein
MSLTVLAAVLAAALLHASWNALGKAARPATSLRWAWGPA